MQKWIMFALFYLACAVGLVLLVTDLPGTKEQPPAEVVELPELPLNVAAAEAIYKQSCIACHGDQLQGGMGPKLSTIGATRTKEQLYKVILDGKGMMPAFKSSLSNEEIVNLANWFAEMK